MFPTFQDEAFPSVDISEEIIIIENFQMTQISGLITRIRQASNLLQISEMSM